jgi:hypothetical protein
MRFVSFAFPHPRVLRILSAGAVGILAVASASPSWGRTACGAPASTLFVERFISAECLACWRANPPMPAAPAGDAGPAVVLDWIVPGRDDAPLGAASIEEAGTRAAEFGSLRADETLTQTAPLPGRSALRVAVDSGPALNGYIGVRMRVGYDGGRPLPGGLVGYLALVERLAPGSEGSPVLRQVVRTVAGPLPLDGLYAGAPVEHLRAVRVPQTGNPERLEAVGWVETRPGRALAVGVEREADCPPGT